MNDAGGAATPRRLVYLDNLRVLLTILVILHHIAQAYTDVGEWYYREPVSGGVSAIFFLFLMAVNQAFFMGLFFSSPDASCRRRWHERATARSCVIACFAWAYRSPSIFSC